MNSNRKKPEKPAGSGVAPSLEKKNKRGETALWRAVHERDHKTAISLLVEKADVNTSNVDDVTPIIEAARLGDAIIIPHLLAHGAHPSAKNNSGVSALMVAIDKGHLDCAEKLILHGADLDKINDVSKENLDKVFQRIIGIHRLDLIFNILEPCRALDYDFTFSDKGHSLLQVAISEGDAELVKNLMNARVPVMKAELKLAETALQYYQEDAAKLERDTSVIPEKINAYIAIVKLLRAEVAQQVRPRQIAARAPAHAKAYCDKRISHGRGQRSSENLEKKDGLIGNRKLK